MNREDYVLMGPAAAALMRECERLEAENAKMRSLLLECKRAFLGYPQEARRKPLDLLRDLNSVIAQGR